MVRYEKLPPPQHLVPYVECFYAWEITAVGAASLLLESPPNGFTSITFNYGNCYEVSVGTENYTPVHRSFITGQASKNYFFRISRPIGQIGIVFRPTAIASLFGLPMYEFTDERYDLAAVLGNQVLTLQQKIEDSINTKERISHLVQFLNIRLLRQDCRTDRTDYAANRIFEHKGIINMNTLMDDLYVSKRQFERLFLNKTGVSPKQYARIRRIGYLCNLMASKRWEIKDWADLIYQMGYYDQSHFIRDFSSFTGKSPSRYLKNNKELARFLSEF
ncbi:MAG: AraC family transcriptional regulator [Leadbetterella sp.]|nr:AraC family transcriptional regulator [Leadbetterella sp.]